MATCTIPGCGKPARARGWCMRHWDRWQYHGDPLGGRTQPNAPAGAAQTFFDDVVLAYDGDKCLIWPFWRGTNGYAGIRVAGKTAIVSRLVCEKALGPPPTPEHEAAHSCGRGCEGCVTKRHLSWKTRAENEADKLVHGTHSRGSRNYRTHLTEDDVRQIRALKGVVLQREIAISFGVSLTTVSLIHCRKTWAWLD